MDMITENNCEQFEHNRNLLQGAIEHINQGIAVVDKQLRLVAWNRRYLELFSFPAGLIKVGRPIADVIRHNAEQGLCGTGDPESHVKKRIWHLRQGTSHSSSRIRENGQVIEVSGNPMPDGGFVMSFNDISAYCQVKQALKEANKTLEERVQQRTQELELLNHQLMLATQLAESQARSKSRFLAAVSHDLMQPLNAARLFSSSLIESTKGREGKEQEAEVLARNIMSALVAAEDLISDLIEVSRLEAGKLMTNIVPLRINEILQTLHTEFGILAKQQNIQFDVVPSDVVILSDGKLLRRALQNFLTNAFRYNPQGRVLLGVRRCGHRINIEVWDNGPGIPREKQALIFDEFTRIDQSSTDYGLGLGLAIASGISRVLEHPLGLRSWPNKGTVFSLSVPRGVPSMLPLTAPSFDLPRLSVVDNLRVLCVDDDPDILLAMTTLLECWGCKVKTARNITEVVSLLNARWFPNVVLSDYHLGHEQTGADVLALCSQLLGDDFKGIVISADKFKAPVIEQINCDFSFISKPVKPLKLKLMLEKYAQSRH